MVSSAAAGGAAGCWPLLAVDWQMLRRSLCHWWLLQQLQDNNYLGLPGNASSLAVVHCGTLCLHDCMK
jgi:hypothetical protein